MGIIDEPGRPVEFVNWIPASVMVAVEALDRKLCGVLNTGWVPVDASDAWKDPARRNFFFGAHDEHRVLFTRGRDIRFNPAQQDEPLNFFIYPYAEFSGKTFTGVEHQFSFRDLPQ